MKKFFRWSVYWLIIALGVGLADTYSDMTGYWIGFLTCAGSIITFRWAQTKNKE